MARWPILCAMAVFVFSTTLASPLLAQVGGIPYGPAPLSPWLNLNTKQGGPVDNYHMFVQPQIQLQNTLQAQQMGIQNNAAAVTAMGERVLYEMQSAYGQIQPTGVAGGFMTQRTYFMNFQGTGGSGTTGAYGTTGAFNTFGTMTGGATGTLPRSNTGGFGNTSGLGNTGSFSGMNRSPATPQAPTTGGVGGGGF